MSKLCLNKAIRNNRAERIKGEGDIEVVMSQAILFIGADR